MKQLITCIFLCTIFLVACNSTDKDDAAGKDLVKIVTKPFSDSLKADTFKVQILGDKPDNMHLAFSITSFNGKQIYDVDIKATDLFKNYIATIDLSKKKNQIKFLQEEVNRFFDDENFMEPAVDEADLPDANVPDKAFFDELKKNRLNGFIYRLGKESKNYVAWSDKEGKVKTYYTCCTK
ncbi:hypothetical protein WAE58_25055 [Pedobacter panaciterrae]|jgi:hypothetical protein|uniref:Lipoprotein n=1 Tax=Pedobacter panaciterrae TaxID=363849 RepID=A0ABU8NUT8_9SPHI|nr:hypothetical protein [Pedobacter panaciterrae]NQX52145.1 hypothetical protein [Pedobacter panaciterrae]